MKLKNSRSKKRMSIQPRKRKGESLSTTNLLAELVWTGRPALKKNSRNIGMVYSKKLGRKVPVQLQSKNYSNALKIGLPQIKEQWAGEALGDKNNRLHVQAWFFAGKGAVPDLDGAMVGCGDLLQRAGVVSNDRWIQSWDGSRIIEWAWHKGEPMSHVRIFSSQYNEEMEELMETLGDS